jgi:anti-sigma factor RsiW
MTEQLQPATPTAHAAHDPTSIAALATRDPDLAPADLAAARAALETCEACATLYADLMAISAAVPMAALPARPRDFTLTAADAARLRPALWRRFIRSIGSARDGITFPLAMGLTTLGVAGLLVATVPAFSAGAGGAATTLSTVGAPLPSAAAAAPGALESLQMSAAPDASSETEGGVFTGGDDGDQAAESPAGRNGTAASPEDAAIRDDPSGLSVLVVLAGALLIMGLGLFGLRWSARRLGDG